MEKCVLSFWATCSEALRRQLGFKTFIYKLEYEWILGQMPRTGTLQGNKKLGVRLWMMDGWEIRGGLAGWSAMEDAREEAGVMWVRWLCVWWLIQWTWPGLAGQRELRRLATWKAKGTGAGNVESVGHRNVGGWWNSEENPENYHTLERWGNPWELRLNEQLRGNH